MSNRIKHSIAVHGGAAAMPRGILPADREHQYHLGLEAAMEMGHEILERGGSSLDAVIASVRDQLCGWGQMERETNQTDVRTAICATLLYARSPLLSDVHRAVIRAYGVHDEERNVAYRSTFVVDRDGVLRWGQAGDRDMVRDGAEIVRVLDLIAAQRGTI